MSSEALRLAGELAEEAERRVCHVAMAPASLLKDSASLLRTQAARNAELEAEREKLLATVANDTTMVFDLCAERDQLRTEVERLRTPLTPDELADLCEAWLQKCQLATNIVDAFEAGARAIEAAKEV